jgi:hypothetical protein
MKLTIFFFNLPNQTALVSGVYSTSNRNYYQKRTNNVSGEWRAVDA